MASNCLVCEKVIKDPTTTAKGQDSVFCEGICQGWIHRHCAGLSRPLFTAIVKSDNPFLCLYCSSAKINELMKTINDLENEVQSLKSQHTGSAPYADIVSQHIKPIERIASNDDLNQFTASKIKKPISLDPVSTRKFNLVAFGIKEQQKNSNRHVRLVEDTSDVAKIIKKLDASISDQSIQDCTRLGKFSEGKCRPILVKMSRSCEVSSILSQRRKLNECPGIAIKPDMNPSERKLESLLMSKRWEYIQSGIARNQIKIRGNNIYVDNTKVGSVVNHVYISVEESPMTVEPDQSPDNGINKTN